MSLIRSSLVLATLALCGVTAGAAQSRVVVGFGFPLFWPAPVVIPPPAYYSGYYPGYYSGYYPGYYSGYYPGYQPPSATFSYTPPQARPRSLAPQVNGGYSGEYCQAGPYTCPLVADVPPGGACFCPGHDGRRVRGRVY